MNIKEKIIAIALSFNMIHLLLALAILPLPKTAPTIFLSVPSASLGVCGVFAVVVALQVEGIRIRFFFQLWNVLAMVGDMLLVEHLVARESDIFLIAATIIIAATSYALFLAELPRMNIRYSKAISRSVSRTREPSSIDDLVGLYKEFGIEDSVAYVRSLRDE